MRCAVIVFLALGSLPGVSVAGDQRGASAEEQELETGVRVRVSTAEGDRITGRIEKLTADTLRIEREDESRSLSVPFVELTKIEVSRGRRSRAQAAWTKAKWGSLIGAVPGAISLGVQHEQVGENGSSVVEAAALGALTGALFGGLIGAAIGVITPGEAWEEISPTFHLGPAGRGEPGFSFAVTIGF